MATTSTSASTPSSAEIVWFPDTSALVTIAYHPPLGDAIRAYVGQPGRRRVLVDAVESELHGLGGSQLPQAPVARQALTELAWLGAAVTLTDEQNDLARDIQAEISGGRVVRHEAEHWGESAIIALASTTPNIKPVFVSDDYDARVAAKNHGMAPTSIYRILTNMIRQSKISAADAAAHAAALEKVGRHGNYTAAELTDGKLGRLGRP